MFFQVDSDNRRTVVRLLSSSTQDQPSQKPKLMAIPKPPRARRARSSSFTPNSLGEEINQGRSKFFNRTFSYMPKSFSHHSLDRSKRRQQATTNPDRNKVQSSNSLVMMVPADTDESKRLTFKDIRQILSSSSSNSINSSSTSSLSRVFRRSSHPNQEHIYEEIPDHIGKRPLPPVPKSPPGSDRIIKSIFQPGATKYDILHYLEDAKERGFSDVDEFDLEEESSKPSELQKELHRNNANRVSHISNSSSGSSGPPIIVREKVWSSVDIERNDSGLGSESGHQKRIPKGRLLSDRPSSFHKISDNLCEDCDQVFPRDKTTLER